MTKSRCTCKDNNTDSKFECSPCKEKFSNTNLFYDHLEIVHCLEPIKNPNQLLLDTKDPDLYCSLCNKRFLKKPF